MGIKTVFVVICSVLWFSTRTTTALLDPISLGIGGGLVGIGFYGFDFIKQETYCRLKECCNERYILGDIAKLKDDLDQNLFGQHIAKKLLVPALMAHFSKSTKSKKPLVLSFHGTPGTGKNFVADQIAKAIYLKGVESKFVHKYMGRADFPLVEMSDSYKIRISDDVKRAIEECPRSLFIFDEVDKMPPGVFESITSNIDYHPSMPKLDYSQAIFIFLSNNAGVQISDKLGQLITKGTFRDSTKMSDFEQTLEKVAYNMDGGLKKTSLIEAHLIDHFIPFLPLQKEHIAQCIQAEFRRWGFNKPKEDTVNDIIKQAIVYDGTYGLFAVTGCKILEKKVAVSVWSDRKI